MTAREQAARLSNGFLTRVQSTGLTDEAVAGAIGVSKQFYSEVKNGKKQPTTGFMVGAVRAGLASTFADVAEPVPAKSAA